MLLRVLALAALLIASPALAAPKPSGELRLVDLTDAFATTWAATEALPEAGRPAAFEARFAPILPDFYRPGREGAGPADRYDARLLRALKAYPAQRAGIEQVSARFDAMFQPARTAFERRFGPMTGYPPVYLVNSLGEFDGARGSCRARRCCCSAPT